MSEDSIKYKVTTTFGRLDGAISQELVHEMRDTQVRLMTWVMETRERGAREALIKLGWTPPIGE
jgi:hypothetical protein